MSEPISIVDRLSDNRFTKPFKRALVRTLVCNSRTRPLVNAFYRSLSDAGKSKYHGRYASMFEDSPAMLAAGHWTIEFLGRMLRLPLRPDQSWLDWDLAVAILGHDLEVKRTYAEVVRSPDRPDVFQEVRPMIVFESNRAERRAGLHALLARHSYVVELLPWTRRGQGDSLPVALFVESGAGNFLARHRPS